MCIRDSCGVINPEKIDEYIGTGGYEALGIVLTEKKPEDVIQILLDSGLRGRGGAGFPTGLKWKFAAGNDADQKYVCCNADEGDPGAFMDRSILEGDPHAVLEAMAIAGYAIGASQGYIYVRAEYPIAVQRLEIAIEQAREYGLLGKNIFDSGFDFDIELRLGAGAFVCGEETALMTSIEGNRGEPRPRPPFPALKGLFQKPTILNNVETYANIPQIIVNGPEWFASMGTEKSKGTKVFALGGKIHNTGLVEIPMGTTLREIVEAVSYTHLDVYKRQRYIYFNLNVKPFDDVRVREAFNLAVDREELCKIVGEDTEPTYNLVAKYMKDKNTGKYFTEEAEQPFEENIERAQKLLAEAGYPEGKGFPELTYSYPSLELDSDTAQVIREQLKKNLNIEIKLNAQELQTNYSMRHAGNFDLCRMNWTADFSDPYTYLSMLLSDSTYNCSGIKNEQYDELVRRSDSETDPVKRSALMHEAEQLAVGEQFYILPLYAMKSVNLVNPKIEGIRQIPASGALEYRYAKIRTGHSEK